MKKLFYLALCMFVALSFVTAGGQKEKEAERISLILATEELRVRTIPLEGPWLRSGTPTSGDERYGSSYRSIERKHPSGRQG